MLAAGEPVQVLGFGDAGPGASLGVPLRAARLAVPTAAAPDVLAFLRAQRPPYLAAHVSTAALVSPQGTGDVRAWPPTAAGGLAAGEPTTGPLPGCCTWR